MSNVTYETYTVKEGDTLAKIAVFLWGDIFRWRKLAEANAISDPFTLKVGQKILVPVNTIPIKIKDGVRMNISPLIIIMVGIVIYVMLRKSKR